MKAPAKVRGTQPKGLSTEPLGAVGRAHSWGVRNTPLEKADSALQATMSPAERAGTQRYGSTELSGGRRYVTLRPQLGPGFFFRRLGFDPVNGSNQRPQRARVRVPIRFLHADQRRQRQASLRRQRRLGHDGGSDKALNAKNLCGDLIHTWHHRRFAVECQRESCPSVAKMPLIPTFSTNYAET